MKKILLLLLGQFLTFGVYAQTKKISRVEVYNDDDVTPCRIYGFHYDEYGRMLGSGWTGNDNGSVRVTYNDDNTIKIENFEEIPDLEWTMAYIENGRITKLDAQYLDEDMYTSTLTYNNDELVSFTQGMKYNGDTYTSNIEWHDGNIVSVVYEDGGRYDFSLSSYDTPSSFPFFMEFIDGVADFALPNPFYYLPDYMGKRSKKLLSGYTAQIDDTKLQMTYSYKFDEYGNVSEIISDEVVGTSHWRERIVCSYMDVVSGIDDVAVDCHGSRGTIYNAAGQQRPDMSKGLNIVRSADGTVRKVLIK